MSRQQQYPVWTENVLLFQTAFSKLDNEKDNKLFYGVELEAEPDGILSLRDAAVAICQEIGDYVNVREDGSVDNGFEIVSVPATLNFHREVIWKNFFDKSGADLRDTNQTGLHIHFSRDATTDKQLAKIIYFVHETSNSGFLSKIAGRRVWAEAKWAKQRKKAYIEGNESSIIREETGPRGALSVSTHYSGKTCEMRIFKSNPTKHGVLQALEFVDCLLSYCALCPNSEKELTYKQFLSWYQDMNMKEQYPYLQDNLILHGMVGKLTLGQRLLGRTA